MVDNGNVLREIVVGETFCLEFSGGVYANGSRGGVNSNVAEDGGCESWTCREYLFLKSYPQNEQ